MEGEFFEVHGSKFKPAPFADLRKVSDEGVAHPMLLFRSSETPLDRFFSLVIELSHPDRVPDILDKLHVIHPDMFQDSFLMPFALCAFRKTWAFFAYLRAALKFLVPLTIRCRIFQNLIFRADHAIINILIWPEIAIFAIWTLVRKNRSALAFEDFASDCRRFVARIHHNIFDLWKFFDQAVIIQLKNHAVMDISGCYLDIENVAVFVASRVCFIRKLLFVFAFVENGFIS